MKRYRAIRDFLTCLNSNDVAIFSGKEASKEAYMYDREGNLYVLDSPGTASSLGLGVAMSTNKRVFVFVGDGEFLMEIGSAAQMAASRCLNLTYIVLDNGVYQSAGGQPTIFREVGSVKGLLFGLGFTVFDLTPYFKDKKSITKMSKIVDKLKGPTAIIIKVDRGENKKVKNIETDKIVIRDRISGFIRNLELGTSLFVPPTFDIGNIMDGGR